MKNFFVLLAVATAAMFSSCTQVKDAGYCGVVELVSKTTKQGKRFGVKFGGEVVIPPVFHGFAEGIDPTSIYLFPPENKNVVYLFDNRGVEILTGRRSGKKELGFEPVPIKVKEDADAHRISSPGRTYFSRIFDVGDYYLFDIADGTCYALFKHWGCRVYGPYRKFFPGSSGYMYQDVKTGKWGAMAAERTLTDGYGHTKERIEEQKVFAPEYEQVIEVVHPQDVHVWFARKGNQWEAKRIVLSKDSAKITNVAVDRNLLNRVLKMSLRTEAKGKVEWINEVLAFGQRVGTQEASIAFI